MAENVQSVCDRIEKRAEVNADHQKLIFQVFNYLDAWATKLVSKGTGPCSCFKY
jgi:hypothetical protein